MSKEKETTGKETAVKQVKVEEALLTLDEFSSLSGMNEVRKAVFRASLPDNTELTEGDWATKFEKFLKRTVK